MSDGIERTNYGVEFKEYSYTLVSTSMGRNKIVFDCPFCGVENHGYVWSLSGSGKRCACGVLHAYGTSFDDKNKHGNKQEMK
jgi:hypothetical protein